MGILWILLILSFAMLSYKAEKKYWLDLNFAGLFSRKAWLATEFFQGWPLPLGYQCPLKLSSSLPKRARPLIFLGLHFLSFLPPSFSMCVISPPLIHGCLLLPWWAVVDWVQAPWLWPGFQSNLVLVSSLWGKYLAASSKKWEWQREPILHGWPRLEKTLLPQIPNWMWG